jgi:hypothetical protein
VSDAAVLLAIISGAVAAIWTLIGARVLVSEAHYGDQRSRRERLVALALIAGGWAGLPGTIAIAFWAPGGVPGTVAATALGITQSALLSAGFALVATWER